MQILSAKTLNGPTREPRTRMYMVNTEILCTSQAYALEFGNDLCEAYLDVEIRAFSFSYLKVESIKSHKDHEILVPEIAYSFKPDDSYFYDIL